MRELNKIFSEALGREVELKPTDTTDTIDGWTSLAHLALVIELEEFYDVRFTPDEIMSMTSVKRIMELIDGLWKY